MLGKFINVESLIHSTKTAIACALGYGVTQLLNFPSDLWIVVTIIVVMCAQVYVGSVLQKAYLRFLGTLLGCLFAAFTIEVLGASDINAVATLSIAGFIFSYIATKQGDMSYIGTLGCITTAIIMISGNPTVTLAFERFLEITIGIIIASLVSQFILPINARTHLRGAQAATLTKLRDYYQKTMLDKNEMTLAEDNELDETIVKLLSTQRQLAKESAREHLGLAFNPQRFLQCLYAEKEMLRAMSFMRIAVHQIQKDQGISFIHSEALATFNQSIIDILNHIIKVVETEATLEAAHLPQLDALKVTLQQNVKGKFSQENTIHVDGFIFSAEILIASLAKITSLYIPTELTTII